MPQGKVKSFSKEKGYGFISANDETYFFHKSQLPEGLPISAIKKGTIFSFDDVPTPRGIEAKKLTIIEQTFSSKMSCGFIVRKDSKLKYGTISRSISIKSPFFRNPQDCKDALINAAKKAGCNGVLNMKVHRNTWSEGNYYYSMHEAHGTLVCITEDVECKRGEQTHIEKQLTNKLDKAHSSAIEIVKEYDNQRFWQTFPWGKIIGSVIIIGLLVAFS